MKEFYSVLYRQLSSVFNSFSNQSGEVSNDLYLMEIQGFQHDMSQTVTGEL